MKRPDRILGLLLAACAACGEPYEPLATPSEPEERVCLRAAPPTTYEIYFVIDVSGSMESFLTDLEMQLVSFAERIPERDDLGRRTRVDYYVIGFVNDYEWFPRNGTRRMTSPIQVQDAIRQAIQAGKNNRNLTHKLPNTEEEENLLDALAEVIASKPTADARLIFIATDAGFVEGPAMLSANIPVSSSYASVRNDLETLGFRIHAFTDDAVDGLTRSFHKSPALTTLPGSSVHTLADLDGSSEKLGQTLSFIAENTACN